ncbi:RcpC/CpaB family pilus assembly protein [Glutamicibacter sp.]|uniref:RcpC/CpaB family pilus assembly protein n=1 Tax=Glutamicibacter sp. TaxID=1931995 RepID=UPI0028BD475F|nr:RcpC/CpaB family pilus assembly protein [Glutamicibacter sp.]
MSRTAKSRAPKIPRPKLRPARTRSELLRRYRRPAGIACLLLAAAAALNLLASGQLGQRSVVVAVGDLPAGAVLTSGDVQLQQIPADANDRQLITNAQDLIGQRLAIAVPAGTALRDFLLVGPQLLTGSPQGTVAVPIRLSDAATVALIHPGQLVDIVLTTGDGFENEIRSETIAKSVAVLWVPAAESSEFGMLGAGASPGEGIIVVAAASTLSDDLAGAITRGKVSAVLVN